MAQRDVLFIFDQAVFNLIKSKTQPYFNRLYTEEQSIDESDISSHYEFATPERPFGFEGPEDSNPTAEMDEDRAFQTLPSPRISLTRTDMQFDMSRNNTNVWRNVRPWGGDGSQVVTSHYPAPWTINYQVDIYARYREEANKLLHWFMMHPSPYHAMAIDMGYPWGCKYLDLRVNRILDTSTLETGERERWIRNTIPLSFEAYMMESFDDESDIPPACDRSGRFTWRTRTVKQLKVQYVDWYSRTVMLTETYGEDGLVASSNEESIWTGPGPDNPNGGLSVVAPNCD